MTSIGRCLKGSCEAAKQELELAEASPAEPAEYRIVCTGVDGTVMSV